MNDFLNNPLMQLLLAVVFVSFIVMEARGWRRAFRGMRAKREAGASLPELPLARTFSFLMNCAGYADAALVTLIAKDMLAPTPWADNTLLLALPLTASYLAYLVSGPLRVKVVRKRGLRGGLVLSATGSLVTFALVAGSVAVGNFWAFVAAVLVNRCFFYLIASCVRLMPTIAESEHERIEINTENDNADVSAAALVGLVAGFTAQYLGNAYVYVVAMVPCAILVAMVAHFVPRDLGASAIAGASGEVGPSGGAGGSDAATPDRRAASTGATKTGGRAKVDFGRVRAFMLQPSMLALFSFALITLGFSACYRSYLFPLFADEGGLNKAAISTITVFCSAFVFYAAPPLTRLAHRVGPRLLLTVSLVASAVAFLGFLVSGSLVWAVVALFLVLLIKKVGEPCARTLWPRAADEQRLPRAEGQAAYEVVDGVICFAKMPVTGALLSFGQVIACAIFGIFAAISAAAFWLSTRKGPFAD